MSARPHLPLLPASKYSFRFGEAGWRGGRESGEGKEGRREGGCPGALRRGDGQGSRLLDLVRRGFGHDIAPKVTCPLLGCHPPGTRGCQGSRTWSLTLWSPSRRVAIKDHLDKRRWVREGGNIPLGAKSPGVRPGTPKMRVVSHMPWRRGVRRGLSPGLVSLTLWVAWGSRGSVQGASSGAVGSRVKGHQPEGGASGEAAAHAGSEGHARGPSG